MLATISHAIVDRKLLPIQGAAGSHAVPSIKGIIPISRHNEHIESPPRKSGAAEMSIALFLDMVPRARKSTVPPKYRAGSKTAMTNTWIKKTGFGLSVTVASRVKKG